MPLLHALYEVPHYLEPANIRKATSNDAWGPTGTEMAEIAALTFNRCVSLLAVPDAHFTDVFFLS